MGRARDAGRAVAAPARHAAHMERWGDLTSRRHRDEEGVALRRGGRAGVMCTPGPHDIGDQGQCGDDRETDDVLPPAVQNVQRTARVERRVQDAYRQEAAAGGEVGPARQVAQGRCHDEQERALTSAPRVVATPAICSRDFGPIVDELAGDHVAGRRSSCWTLMRTPPRGGATRFSSQPTLLVFRSGQLTAGSLAAGRRREPCPNPWRGDRTALLRLRAAGRSTSPTADQTPDIDTGG